VKYLILFPLAVVALILTFVVLALGYLWHFNEDRAVDWAQWWFEHTFEPLSKELYEFEK